MYHTHCKGTRYQMGYEYGSSLFTREKYILDNTPLAITCQRLDFAKACLPHYERWFPAVLDEIQGIADGQHCSFEQLIGLLFSMYCFVPEIHCSCFAVRSCGNVIFGRNSDFLTSMEKLNTNCLYRFSDTGYDFCGNTTAFVEMEDGINQYGLAIGLTSVYPSVLQPGLNAGMILRLILETCSSVSQAMHLIDRLPLASSQTFVLADSHEIALVECNAERMEILRPTQPDAWVCSTNVFHLPSMQSYHCALEDNWQAEERYQTICHSLAHGQHPFTAQTAMDILAGKEGFLCQYDRNAGRDTVWSVVCDLAHQKLYRAEGNPSRKPFREDRRFSFIL